MSQGISQLNLVEGPINNIGGVAPVTDERQVAWGIGAQGLYNKDNEAYSLITTDDQIKKGDVAFYGNTSSDGSVRVKHISLIYSERWGKSARREAFGTVYDIIHANGTPSRTYTNEGELPSDPVFARKVRIDSIGTAINSGTLIDPKRFGRIKIWE